MFLKAVLKAGDKIRGKVETHKPILMQEQVWIDFKEATHCDIGVDVSKNQRSDRAGRAQNLISLILNSSPFKNGTGE